MPVAKIYCSQTPKDRFSHPGPYFSLLLYKGIISKHNEVILMIKHNIHFEDETKPA